MVVRGGENIYPREIEEFLFTHPAIIDVQVVGLPDQKYGEELSAWIQLKPDHHLTKEAVASFCKGKISHFKIPIYIFFVDSYPTTVTGKIQKFKLRELGIKKLKAKKFVKKTGPGNSSFMLQNTED
jgi:fatty-acyl-CoA synthase